MIAYLLLTNISRMFSSMPGLAGGSPAIFARGRSSATCSSRWI